MQVKKKPKKTAKAVPEKSRKKKQPSEDQIKKQPFLKRMLFGEEKPDLSELEAGSTTILDILSPTTVDTKSRDYIIVDDVYHAYLYTATARRHICIVPKTSVFSISSLRSPKIRMHSTRSAERTGGFP